MVVWFFFFPRYAENRNLRACCGLRLVETWGVLSGCRGWLLGVGRCAPSPPPSAPSAPLSRAPPSRPAALARSPSPCGLSVLARSSLRPVRPRAGVRWAGRHSSTAGARPFGAAGAFGRGVGSAANTDVTGLFTDVNLVFTDVTGL